MRLSTCFKESLKAELYNELRAELATKEFVRAEINGVRAEISEVRSELKQNLLLLKILIGITVFGLTLFNPAFVKLVGLAIICGQTKLILSGSGVNPEIQKIRRAERRNNVGILRRMD